MCVVRVSFTLLDLTDFHDGSTGDRTAFISNLLFDVDEEKLREFFKKVSTFSA